ncbi:hypothetical protein TRVA0_022S02300 [Trichomonascus vanleenenianus]|uniref:Sip5p n=1 Tax=Trichomonascus vanleenenianus TaxID=2268995 RepID=UPI003ECAAD2E
MGNVNAKESRSRSSSTTGAGGSSGSPAVSLSGAGKRRLRSNTTPAGMGVASRRSERSKKKHVKSQQELDAEEIANLVFDPDEIVDGGYLVPHGIYTGAQTYKYKIVRQLVLERRLAPFYKPLADYDEDWTDRQVLAAIRGLPTHPPPPSECAPEEAGGSSGQDPLMHTSSPPAASNQEGTMSPVARSVSIDGSSTATDPSTMPTSSSDTPDDPNLVQNGFFESEEETELPPGSGEYMDKPIVALEGERLEEEEENEDHESLDEVYALKQQTEHVECAPMSRPVTVTRNRSNTSPRYRSGKNNSNEGADKSDTPIEVQVYRGAMECPICFLFFPKYLNHTRCCGQPICTECFVQIKRAEPHPPYQNPDAPPSSSASSTTTNTADGPSVAETLVSDPACCPYCAAPDFGVVYFPSKFRYGQFPKNSSAFSSLNNLLKNGDSNSGSRAASGSGSPHLKEPKFDFPNRKGSIPPSAAEVVTTDQIRPDWLVVLNAARQHQARRSAAATALHATAFLMQQDSSSSIASSAASQRKPHKSSRRFRGLGSSRREEQQGLEDLMLLEAIRLSLNDEETRRQKEQQERLKSKGKGKEPAA